MLIVLTKIQIQTVLGTLVLARLASKGTDSTALVFILYWFQGFSFSDFLVYPENIESFLKITEILDFLIEYKIHLFQILMNVHRTRQTTVISTLHVITQFPRTIAHVTNITKAMVSTVLLSTSAWMQRWTIVVSMLPALKMVYRTLANVMDYYMETELTVTVRDHW